MNTKHIQNKEDWFYEFRPQIVIAFGILGLFSKVWVPGEPVLMKLAQACGIVLLVIGIKILDWRKAYRETYRKLRY